MEHNCGKHLHGYVMKVGHGVA